jgi:methyl-accepting chemotaxis protein
MIAFFNNLRMGVKLLLSFLLVTVIVGVVLSGLSFYNLNNITNILHEITDQRVPSVKNSTAVERYALRTILDEKKYLLGANDTRVDQAKFQTSAMANIDQIIAALDEVDKVAKKYGDDDLLAKSNEVRTVTLQYKELYNQGVEKLKTNTDLATTMATNGTKVVDLAKEYYGILVNQTDDQSRLTLPIVISIWDTALETRLNQNKYMLYHDQKYYTALDAGITKLGTLYDQLDKVSINSQDKKRVSDARSATNDYNQAAQAWVKNDTELSAMLTQMAEIGQKVQDNAVAAEDAGWMATEDSKVHSATVVSQASLITFAAIALAIVLGIVLGVVISRTITNPLKTAVDVAESLSVGNLVRDMSDAQKDRVRLRKDEIGDLGKAFDRLINYMQAMGNAASAIAENDLTVEVKPVSDRDELGNAFKQMIQSLYQAVSQVAMNADSLSAASSQLSSAASQAGQAAGQISTTVQQVALGNSQQTASVTRTTNSVEQLAHAIDGVARGAQEQAQAVIKTAQITGQITQSIQQVSGNAQSVTRNSATAADSARKGTRTVEETVQGMHAIQAKVNLSAQKVQEMGQRSEQIGAIVDTIEDIASQTNLLALNAAIEAARAGEHGKGFAVVAEEVRKLAEKSTTATKEIGSLIKGIQKTVQEAVTAMNEGSKEVESGVKLANQAGQALSEILDAAEMVLSQAREAEQAAMQMTGASVELVNSSESVSAVVEENSAATEQMAASSSEVTQAIENIAAVSEENSASVEEVSASVEEMSAQVEEVAASAESLADMADKLQQVVAMFKLTEGNQRAAQSQRPSNEPPVVKYAPVNGTITTNGHKNGQKFATTVR